MFMSQGQINHANLAMTRSHMSNKWTQLGSSHEKCAHTLTHTPHGPSKFSKPGQVISLLQSATQ